MPNIYKDTKANETAIITYNNGTEKITLSDIRGILETSAINHGFDNLRDFATNGNSSNFNILLQDIGAMFKATKALIITKSDRSPGNYIYNNNIQWEYDKNKLLSLVPVYANLCYEFDKRISLQGFLFFCGIGNVNYFTYDERNNIKLSDNLRGKIAEFLAELDNEHQKNRARDSNQAILQLAYNNYEHGWNGEIKRKEITSTVKTLEDIKNARAELSTPGVQDSDLTL